MLSQILSHKYREIKFSFALKLPENLQLTSDIISFCSKLENNRDGGKLPAKTSNVLKFIYLLTVILNGIYFIK